MLEKTVIIVKHDGIQRGLVGEVIKRFEQKGLRIAAIKMTHPDKEISQRQYRLTEDWIKKIGETTRKTLESRGIKVKETNEQIAKRVQRWLMDYLTEGPVAAMIFEGYHAIEIGRKIIGTAEARSAPPGTIRGDFSTDSYELGDSLGRPVRNIVHASGNKEEAENEIKIWFSKKEIHDYTKHDWKIIH